MCLHPSHRRKSDDTIAWLRKRGLHSVPNSIKAELGDLVYNGPKQKNDDSTASTPPPGRRADAVAKRYRPWPKGLRADSLPWFDSPLVQGASRLRYTDKAQVAATGPYWPKGARNKKKIPRPLGGLYISLAAGHPMIHHLDCKPHTDARRPNRE